MKINQNINNNLKKIILDEQKKMYYETGYKVRLSDIKKKVAFYCNTTDHNIDRIYKKYSLPSLEVALKMAEYFETDINNIFSLKNERNDHNEKK